MKNRVVQFFFGFTLHVIVWLAAIEFNSEGPVCATEEACLTLLVVDFPVSLFYDSTNYQFALLSLLVGSLWWGCILPLFIAFIGYIREAIKSSIGIK